MSATALSSKPRTQPQAQSQAHLKLVKKLPREQALLLFPDLEPQPPARECRLSGSGRHEPVDLSGLRYRPTPPFCAWCGQTLA
jgi:hypothetical protein